MTGQNAAGSRAAALAALVESYRQPMDGARLLHLGREMARAEPTFRNDPVQPRPAIYETIHARVAAAEVPHSARPGLLAMALLLDICASGRLDALVRAAQAASKLPETGRLLAALGGFLDSAGLARDLAEAEIVHLAGPLELATGRRDRLFGGLAFLGLSKAAPMETRRRVFELAAAPRLDAAAAAEDVDTLLALESFLYEAYVKAEETPAHHTEVFARIELACSRLPPRPAPRHRAAVERPRIAFLMHNGAVLAHTEVLLSFLRGLQRLETSPIEPIVLIHADPSGGELANRLTAMGVQWQALAFPPAEGHEAHYQRVREQLDALGAAAVVFVSLPEHLAYFCRRPLAPVQIWWSLKFPLPNFEGLDGRVFYRSLLDRQVEVAGRVWRGGPMAIEAPPRPDPAAVAAIRARFPGMRILGTVAREEKIAHPGFLHAVAAILRRHPDACFLWTGRSRLPAIDKAFQHAGVADRCHFVGWVDPAPYIGAFDIFLETYPLTGIMVGWSMAFARPVISVGPMGFLGAYLGPILDGSLALPQDERARIEHMFAPIAGRLPGLWAAGPEDIPAFAEALLKDEALCADVGRVQQSYLAAYLGDEPGSAAAQARHFAQIVSDARNKR